ncbi:hypothetical protein [Streptomyces parvus]|uniref:Uncharacterized protein n=1 Tax=Streptomyces parvus TaxID=66428 RepID=A0A7K3SAM6_9ACTN|nr:hypothetical protein [Streptomyces parvus]NEC24584.1 hypothetical protein [Streptomyces parvus]
MTHTGDSLAAEHRRDREGRPVRQRPGPDAAPPALSLSLFVIDVSGDAAAYSDPDEDSRGWEWWDATVAGPSRVPVRVDSWGESSLGCQDLLWAVFTAGAVRVEGPMVQITSFREKP